MNSGLTREEILKAAHCIQERKPDFTTRDVWYELKIKRKIGRYSIPARDAEMHFIAAVLLKSGAKSTPDSIGKKRYHFDD